MPVSKVTDHGLDDRSSIPGRGADFCLRYRVGTSSGSLRILSNGYCRFCTRG